MSFKYLFFIFLHLFELSANEDVNVLILTKLHPKKVILNGDYKPKWIKEISLEGNSLIVNGKRRDFKEITLNTDTTYNLHIKNQVVSLNSSIRIKARQGELRIVQKVKAEDYVKNVVHSEVGMFIDKNYFTDQQLGEFLKSFSIVVRSYLENNRNRHSQDGADVCDLTHCMVHKGRKREISFSPPRKVLKVKDDILSAYFHSTCGGELSKPDIWWNKTKTNQAYRSGPDGPVGNHYCKDSPHSHWRFRVKKTELSKALLNGLDRIRFIEPIYRGSRVTSLTLKTERKTTQMGVAKFSSLLGKRLGWNKLKSNYFSVNEKGETLEFTGHGLGHGIGLCQYGARELARKNWSYDKILSFYFPGAKLESL